MLFPYFSGAVSRIVLINLIAVPIIIMTFLYQKHLVENYDISVPNRKCHWGYIIASLLGITSIFSQAYMTQKRSPGTQYIKGYNQAELSPG